MPIDSLYETSFYLIYKLGIQPSEVSNLSIHESKYYINMYLDLKNREREAIQQAKNSNKDVVSNSGFKRFLRHRKK